MLNRYRLFAVSLNIVAFAGLLAGCGSYGDEKKAATGGASGTSATGGASGSAPTGGASGTATGGAGGSSSGQSGSGGSGQPTGGAGGSGAGTGGASGAGGGQASCTDAAPCGGDVLGTWSAASCMVPVGGMADMAAAGLGCTTAPATGSLQVTGTWTAMAGGMYSDTTTTTGQVVIELAASCLMVSGFATTCDRIVLDSVGLPSPDPPAQLCVDNAATGGCTCTAHVNQMGGLGFISLNAAPSGTYMSAANNLTLNAFGVDTAYSYCVAGSALTMKPTTMNAAPLMGPIVLQKQ